MEKKEILLPSKKYFKADEQDLNLNVKLENDETLLREGDMNIVLNLADLFNNERNKSINYKIYGKMKMVFRNMYSGYTTYEPLLKNLYLNGDGSDGNYIGFVPYNEFAFLRNDVLRETTTPSFGNSLGGQNVRPVIELTGNERNTGHTITSTLDAPYKNWNLYMTYVYDQDKNYPMKYTLSGNTVFSFTAGDGIPFRVENNGNYYTLTSPVEHGMLQGEYIILSGGTYTSYSGVSTGKTFYTIPITSDTEKYRIYYIDSVGNQTYNSENYVINILKNEFSSGTTLSSVVLGRRCLDDKNITGSTSTYYVHKHKTLTTKDDYILDKVGFENLLFEDERKIIFENPLGENDMIVERNRQESVLFDFKKTFKLTDIKNNLGYTPTEVYVSFIFKNGNGLFDYPPKVGFKFNFHDTWIDQSFSGTTKTTYPYEFSMSTGTTFKGNKYTDLGVNYNYTGVTFTGGTFLPLGTSGLTGAFVEYNIKEIKERIISESYHRFSHVKSISGVTIFDHNQDNSNNTRPKYSGASINNTVGYYYQPHHRIKLRQLSPYIESSRTKEIINLPENVIFDDKEYLWKWRDLYDHGFIDQEGNGTNFPFINNTHYVVNDINFYLRNEIAYTNKNDLFSGFNNYKNKTNC